jgi:hypothetical protein
MPSRCRFQNLMVCSKHGTSSVSRSTAQSNRIEHQPSQALHIQPADTFKAVQPSTGDAGRSCSEDGKRRREGNLRCHGQSLPRPGSGHALLATTPGRGLPSPSWRFPQGRARGAIGFCRFDFDRRAVREPVSRTLRAASVVCKPGSTPGRVTRWNRLRSALSLAPAPSMRDTPLLAGSPTQTYRLARRSWVQECL